MNTVMLCVSPTNSAPQASSTSCSFESTVSGMRASASKILNSFGVTYVGIDVNPSIELALNRFNIVVETHALNDDGQRALDEVPCMWRPFDDAARDLDGAMRAIAGEGAVVEVSIDCDNESRYAALAAQSNNCFGCNGEAHCNRTSAEERQAAHDSGMGVAKYRAYQELQEAGVDISAEKCASMSMRDLLAKSGVDENEEKDKHAGMGYGQGRGAHNGNRAGDHGSGNENRNSNGSNSVDDNGAREQ